VAHRQGDHTSRFDRDSPGLMMHVPVSQENRSGRSNVPVWQQASPSGRMAQNFVAHNHYKLKLSKLVEYFDFGSTLKIEMRAIN